MANQSRLKTLSPSPPLPLSQQKPGPSSSEQPGRSGYEWHTHPPQEEEGERGSRGEGEPRGYGCGWPQDAPAIQPARSPDSSAPCAEALANANPPLTPKKPMKHTKIHSKKSSLGVYSPRRPAPLVSRSQWPIDSAPCLFSPSAGSLRGCPAAGSLMANQSRLKTLSPSPPLPLSQQKPGPSSSEQPGRSGYEWHTHPPQEEEGERGSRGEGEPRGYGCGWPQDAPAIQPARSPDSSPNQS